MFFRRLPLVLVLIVIEFGCTKKPEGRPPRYAVVRFENLTGDPALDWVGRAASEVLSVSLGGAMDGPVLRSSALGRVAQTLGVRQPTAPGTSSERAEARLAGANRLISGYIERAGRAIRIVAAEENLASGRTLRTVAATGAPLPALNQLAREFSPRARPYLSSNAEAVEDYFVALEAPIGASEDELRKAVELDPDFGPPWLSLTRLDRLKRDPGAAQSWIAQARGHKLDALSLAELDSEAAALNGDEPARIAAMRKAVALSPGDVVLQRTLADNETAAGQFAEAASDWGKLAAELPDDSLIRNSLGYARSWAGDYAGALAALREYRRLRPNEANPLDSLGDLHYINRKFGDAASYYQQAYAKDPKFERAGDLYKAAWATFRAGDAKGADALFAQFQAAREKLNDPLLPLLKADWLYRTGHTADGVALLRKTAEETQSAPVRAESRSQLAIWELLAGDRTAAWKDGLAAGTPSNVPMLMMRFAVEPSASASEWQTRAERVMSAPAMAPVRRVAVGYALLLDGKRQAALPVWEQIVKSTPATDFFSRAVYARLQKQANERPVLPDANNLNQFAALLDRL